MTIEKDTMIAFSRLVREAVRDGLTMLKNAVSAGAHVSSYHWPKLEKLTSGFPQFSRHEPGKHGPLDYKSIFSKNNGGLDRPMSFGAVIGFAQRNDALRAYFSSPSLTRGMSPDKAAEYDSIFFQSSVESFVLSILERHVQARGVGSLEDSIFDDTWAIFERRLSSPELSVTFVVPIVCTPFTFEEASISRGVTIQRMSDEVQLARAMTSGYTAGVHPHVVDSATHAIFVRGQISNNFRLQNEDAWYNAGAYPIDNIERFLAALRVVTGAEIGFAKILIILDSEWSLGTCAYLPEVLGCLETRAYPVKFERHSWRLNSNPISEADATAAGVLASQLEDKRFHVAYRRINQCYLREHEDDSVLDAAIALESLLIEGSQGEITHKLSLRAAALAKLGDMCGQGPREVFRNVKKIYGLRSKIAHGDKGAAKKDKITIGDVDCKAHEAALRYLRAVMITLSKHSKYLHDPNAIDEDLLLGAAFVEARDAADNLEL